VKRAVYGEQAETARGLVHESPRRRARVSRPELERVIVLPEGSASPGGQACERCVAFASVVALIVPIGVLGVAPVGAASGLSCTIPEVKVAVSPGLTNVPTVNTIAFKVPLKSCKGTPGITSGTAKGTLISAKKGTCASLANAGPLKIIATVKWSNAQTSGWTGTATMKVAGGKITSVIAGAMTKGLFSKQRVSATVSVSLDPTGGSCTKANPMKRLIVKGTKPFVLT